MITPIDQRAWFCGETEKLTATMYRFGMSILRNDEDVKDAVQDAVCTAYEKLDSLRDKTKFKPWILKILANSCYDTLRKRKRVVSIEDCELPLEAEKKDVDGCISVREAVKRLSDEYRAPTVLFYYEGMSIREIGAVLRLPENTVKTRLSRARQQLRSSLAEGGDLTRTRLTRE